MNNTRKIIQLFVAGLLSLSATICRATDFTPEELYGAWENIGSSNLGISGIMFITPSYVAYLEKSNNSVGYIFSKYTYSISNDDRLLNVPGFGWFKIEKQRSGRIILNRTKWIIPHVLSYDGIIKRAKIKESALRVFLSGLKLDIETMKNTPIKNLTRTPLSQKELQNLKNELCNNNKDISDKIKIKLMGNNREFKDYSIPIEISKIVESKQ